MVTHWIRRHRAITLTAATATLIACASVTAYIRNIAAARDNAETANHKLTLEHAELLLHTDPTAAVATLAGYQGSDILRLRRLQAEAQGRGAATGVFAPHADTVWLVLGERSGDIISLAQDQKIVVTRDGVSTTIASDVSVGVCATYAPATRLLAYATTPHGLSILDLNTRKTRIISASNPKMLVFSPDGLKLGVLNPHDELVVWSLDTNPRQVYRDTVPGVRELSFANSSRIDIRDQTTIKVIALDSSTQGNAIWTSVGMTSFDAQPEIVAAADDRGTINVLSSNLAHMASYSACHKRVNTVRMIPATNDISYACMDGVFGILRYNTTDHTIALIDTVETHGSTFATPSHFGRYVAITDESLSTYIYDATTRTTVHYDGNAGRPTAVSAPTPDSSYILIGDNKGTIRRWNSSVSAARVVQQIPVPIFGLSFSRDGSHIVANGADRKLYVVDLSNDTTTELRGHEAGVRRTGIAPDGTSMLSFGYDGTVRVWDAVSHAPLRVFADHSSIVEDAVYIDAGRRIASIGDDGRLLTWSANGNDTFVLFTHQSPLVSLEVLKASNHLVVADNVGEVWDVSPDGRAHQIRIADSQTITELRASTEGRRLAIGTDRGAVTVYDTATWKITNFFISSGAIRQIEFDPLNRDVLVAAEGGASPTGQVQLIPLGTRQESPWSSVVILARTISYSYNGQAIAFVCFDGGTWLYSRRDNLWSYTRDHDADALAGVFSPDGKLFASSDRHGRIVIRDVKLTFANTSNQEHRIQSHNQD
jgi:WD40 repeat protein